MTQQFAGQTVVGMAFESVVGTYVAPTKWIPLRSESFHKVEDDKNYRLNMRGSADRRPGNAGHTHIEGDIEFEVTDDTLLYILYLARLIPAKTGAGPFTYTFTPANVMKPTTAASGPTNRRTASFLVARSSLGLFGYTGCSVSQLAFSYDNSTFVCTATLMGLDEAQQTLGAQTWPTTGPFGPLHNTVEIPSATVRQDIIGSNFTINDNLAPQLRQNGSRAPAYLGWGEREVTIHIDHDFDSLTDYNVFLNQTKQTLLFKHSQGANNQVNFSFFSTIEDNYDLGESGLGDPVQASTDFHATSDPGDSWQVVVISQEVIT